MDTVKPYQIIDGKLSNVCYQVDGHTYCTSFTEAVLSAMAEGHFNDFFLAVMFLAVLVIGFILVYKLLSS